MDKRYPRNNRIRPAIDGRLSGMETSPDFERKVLGRVRGEVVVKKKLSAAFVLIMVLILLAVGALAAVLLSARELVDQQAVPMASQSEGDSYSVEETNILLKLAKENGISLSEHAKESINKFLSNGQGYYKEEMVMALAKAEFGEDPASWTLEEQKWFDDVCVAIGFIEEPQKAMPAAGEISQEQAETIAEEYIHSHYDTSVDLHDASVYKHGVQYIDGNADGEYPGHYWTIFYEPLIATAADYWIYINSKGEVWKGEARPGYKEGDDINTILNCFIGPIYSWEFSTWGHADLQFFCKAVASSSSTNDRAVLCIKQMAYPDISADAMSAEEAGRIAAKALDLTEDAVKGAVYIGDDPNPVWKVKLFIELPGSDPNRSRLDSFARYYVEVDSITGEVKNIYKRDNQYDHWYCDIVLQKIIEEVDATWVDNTPSVG